MKSHINKKTFICFSLIAIVIIVVIFPLSNSSQSIDINETMDPRIRHNVPYVCINAPGDGEAYVFYEDYMHCRFFIDPTAGLSNNFFTHEVMIGYRCHNSKVLDPWDGTEYKFSADGSSFEFRGKTYVATGVTHGIYLEDIYANDKGDTLVFSDTGSAIFNNNTVTVSNDWSRLGYRGRIDSYYYFVSLDGETIILTDDDAGYTSVFRRGDMPDIPNIKENYT